ncbi:MAG: hypothetical protein BMS9Abin34_138 [Patescibacteria group bacterium]|nr:MAG: hypothetical protein BMS9Abin34_138 [Patescibacteria group bacterium]
MLPKLKTIAAALNKRPPAPLKLTQAPLVFGLFGLSFIAAAVGIFALLLSLHGLPDRVPLLFTTGETLTNKLLLFSLPLLSLLLIAGDALVSEVLLRRQEKAAALFPAFLSLFVSTILASSLIRIIKIFPFSPLPFEPKLYPLLLPLGTAVVLGLALTAFFVWLARRRRLFDLPHGPYPQVRPIPRLGALPLFLTFSAVALLFTPLDKSLIALLAGGALITLIQTIDDLHPLPASVQGGGHLLAALIVIAGGVGIDFIGNPLSQWVGPDYIRLDIWEIPFNLGEITYQITVLADLFTLAWIFALVNVVDWLDGLDGLAAGVGVIAGITIVVVSLLFNTPTTALLGVILVGTLLGFLPLNFFPARIYLGGGAFLLGYFLAVFSIFSGAKTGTALLVLAIPIIDAFYVIYQRVRAGKSPFTGDKNHLHHRLLEAGFAHPKIVLLEWLVVAALAAAAVMLKGFSKLAAVGFVFATALLVNKLLLKRFETKVRKSLRPSR